MNTELLHDNKRKYETGRIRAKGQFLTIGASRRPTRDDAEYAKRPSIVVFD